MTKKTRAKARRALLTLSLVLVMMFVAVGGTIAWLTDKTESVTNTFAPTNIDITLTETNRTYPMVPGQTVDKDPKVSITAASEDAWIFVMLEKKGNYAEYLENYQIADGWKAVPGVDDVYYRGVAKTDTTREFPVLKDNQVKVLDSVTNAMMADITAGKANVQLVITAYAIQQASFPEANIATAWTEAQKAAIYPAAGN